MKGMAIALTRLYPASWRDRYGDEFEALLEQCPAGAPARCLTPLQERSAPGCAGRPWRRRGRRGCVARFAPCCGPPRAVLRRGFRQGRDSRLFVHPGGRPGHGGCQLGRRRADGRRRRHPSDCGVPARESGAQAGRAPAGRRAGGCRRRVGSGSSRRAASGRGIRPHPPRPAIFYVISVLFLAAAIITARAPPGTAPDRPGRSGAAASVPFGVLAVAALAVATSLMAAYTVMLGRYEPWLAHSGYGIPWQHQMMLTILIGTTDRWRSARRSPRPGSRRARWAMGAAGRLDQPGGHEFVAAHAGRGTRTRGTGLAAWPAVGSARPFYDRN